MGRFDALEFETPEAGTPEKPQGEAIADAQSWLDDGCAHFFRADYERALKSYSRAAGMDPGSPEAWLGQVLCLVGLQEFHEAELWYVKAAETIGENADLLAARALIAARTGDFDRACGYSDSALSAGGTGAFPMVVRGEIFLYARKNAEYCFDQACALSHGDWKIRMLIAGACLFARRRRAAFLAGKYLQPALDQHPQSPEILFAMGKCFLAQKRKRAARTILEQAAALDDSLPKLQKYLDEAQTAGCLFFWKS